MTTDLQTAETTNNLSDPEWAEELVSDREYLYTSGPLTIRMYFGPTSMRYLFELSVNFNGRPVILALEESLAAAKDLAKQFRVVVSTKESAAEIEALRAQVARGDALLAAVRQRAQDESDAKHRAEFGHNGPSVAGVFPGLSSPDRTYVYYRHELSRQFPDLPDAAIALGQRVAPE